MKVVIMPDRVYDEFMCMAKKEADKGNTESHALLTSHHGVWKFNGPMNYYQLMGHIIARALSEINCF